MIDTIILLEKVIKNIQHCKTKEQCEHEIQSMLQEAITQHEKDEVQMMEWMLTEDIYTDESEKT